MKQRDYRDNVINYSSICPDCYWQQLQNKAYNKKDYK